MALGDFLKKKPTLPPPGPAPVGGGFQSAMPPGMARGLTSGQESPVDMVRRMKAQGMNQQQVIDAMQREGFSQTQIYDAIDTSSQLERQQQEPAQQGPMPPPLNQFPQQGVQQQQGQFAQQQQPSPGKLEQVDELIERTVDERWREFSGELKRMDEFRVNSETRLAHVETQLANLDQKFDSLKNAVIAKIKDYDTSILNVGTEMKAMEQVFQKILPELQNNVSELSRITARAGGPLPSRTIKK